VPDPKKPSITGAESSQAFIEALKNGRDKNGHFAIGILVDNRLGESDLSEVRKVCDDHQIILARTWPGNSKSNGHIENNFRIFETFVGDITVTGRNAREISESIAQTIIEIFTQQRNHTPRTRIGSRSPADYPTPDRPPEHIRDAIERLANRFNRETRDIETKWGLIEAARARFEPQSEATQQKLMKQLGKFPSCDLLSAQSKYLARFAKYPDGNYRSEYFMAIVRNHREEIAKRTFNEAWRAGVKRKNELMPPPAPIPPKERAKDILAVFIDMLDLQTPSEWMLELDALSWWLVHYSRQASLPELWTAVEGEVETSKVMSLEQWERIKDYIAAKLGDFLYEPSLEQSPNLQARVKVRGDAPLSTTNLDRQGAKKGPVKSDRHADAPPRD